jgi:hypothetical protein
MDEILGIPIEQRPLQNLKPSHPEKNLVNNSKAHHGDREEYHLQDQQPGHSNEPTSEDGHTTLNAEPQGHASDNSQKKGKAKKKGGNSTQLQGHKKQGKTPTNHGKAPPPPQETPLEAYVGRFWNAGYREMTVTIKDNQLFVDATDRSNGFTMTFEHVKYQTEYIAHARGVIELEDEPVDARFVLEDSKAVKMGLDLEPALKEMIWFERDDSGLK